MHTQVSAHDRLGQVGDLKFTEKVRERRGQRDWTGDTLSIYPSAAKDTSCVQQGTSCNI